MKVLRLYDDLLLGFMFIPKVNDSLITGLRIVDSILPVGRGQRQLILGDRYTGKTSIYLSLLLHCNYLSLLGAIEGLGTKRIFGIYLIFMFLY